MTGLAVRLLRPNYGTTSFDPTIVTVPLVLIVVVLVTGTTYNNRGEAFKTTDATGVVTRTHYDDMGRPVRVIQNFQEEVSAGADANITSVTTYTPDGGVATMTAVNPITGDQTTTFVYGTTLSSNDIARSDLMVAVVYPNATDGTDQVTYQYNRQSQRQQMQDQNGSVHKYSFDGLGRTTSDQVTTLGSGVNNSVLRIDTAYEIRGMVSQVTSYSDVAGTTAVNQVVLTYDQFEDLITDAQNHAGSGGSPPPVNYGYANGTANTTRRTSMTYPNGRVLNIDYATGTEDDTLSRVTDLAIVGDSTVTVQYQYYGLNSFATVTYPMPSSVNVQSLLASGSTYSGLDQFGRIINLPWTKSSPGDLAQLAYGYDQNSNRTYRQDVKAGTANEQDEIYAYDRIQRLDSFRRGALTTGSGTYRLTSLTFAQNWSLDPTGNWSEFSQFDQSLATNGLDQQRTHNTFNQITAVTETAGPLWVTPTYDRNGNTTTLPSPADPTVAYLATYDAWNRLAGVTTAGATPVVAYSYDGLNRRIVVESYSSGTLTETRDLYYSDQWQVLEERVEPNTTAERQYIWGMRYVDDCVLRDRDTTGGGTLNERLYALQDANWNIAAICDNTGTVQERYGYSPYGVVTFYDPSWTVRSSSAYVWAYLFQTGRLESLAGLYNFRYRDDSPLLGRWIQTDPIGLEGGDTNLYGYVAKNPANAVDPLGLGSCAMAANQIPEAGGPSNGKICCCCVESFSPASAP